MIAMIRKFLDLAGERKKQLYLAWLFQALTSICEGAIYFMLFLAIKDILGGSFTREKLIQYSLMFLVYTVLHFVFYYFTIAKQRPVSYAMMRDERLSIAAKIKQFPLYYFTKDKISQLTSLFTTDLSFVEMNIMEIIAGFVSSMIMTVVFAHGAPSVCGNHPRLYPLPAVSKGHGSTGRAEEKCTGGND